VASVVFLRAANVGGTNVFRPAHLATALKRLNVVNIGAAGTFVVRSSATTAAIRRDFLAAMPFVPIMAVRPGSDVIALVRSLPFKGVALSKDLRGWVAVMTERPKLTPALPLSAPPGPNWYLRFDEIRGVVALGLVRRHPDRPINVGKFLETALGVPVTVRWWETIEKIAKILES
jgi:uncharacterized protein (DUF1697 family)